MTGNARLKFAFYANLALIVLLIGYKVYLDIFVLEEQASNARNIESIRQQLEGRANFSFAVVGEINNSIGIFERKIVPLLNASDVDFVVSAGNAVSGGGEDKYRAIQGSLARLRKPVLLAFGPNERSRFGSFRFYEQYGPFFFSLDIGDYRFVFTDATGETPYQWHQLWLSEQLRTAGTDRAFLFVARPLHRLPDRRFFDFEDNYLPPGPLRDSLLQLMEEYPPAAVFSSNLPFFARQEVSGVPHFITGGAGGLVLNDDDSFYHYLKVDVGEADVGFQVVTLDIGQHGIFRFIESLWLFVHSLFYVGFVNFALIVSALVALGIKLYSLIFVERDYYRRFDVDYSRYEQKPLRVAMFTNNYLPFIGGVPISIERLKRGLQGLGCSVLLFAPRYGAGDEGESDVVRVPTLLALGAGRVLRLCNRFALVIRRRFRDFRPHVVHVHHPFVLGRAGLRLGRRAGLPVIYTYHTRLEHYAHYVPIPGPLFRNLISHQLVKRFANRCDAVVVPTYSAEEYLRNIGVTAPIHILPTGIDVERFSEPDPEQVAGLRQALGLGDRRVLVSASRLSREKNIDFLIEAFAELVAEEDQPCCLLIVGGGQEEKRLRAKIETLGLNDSIVLTGPVPPGDMPLYYRLGELFLFASKSETQGMVVLEAMAAGLPVVAVRSSGIDDVVQDGVNGFKTLERRDQWSQCIHRLLADETLRSSFSENAVVFARRHSVENFARAMRDIYIHELAQRGLMPD